jgi:hypothetical protein
MLSRKLILSSIFFALLWSVNACNEDGQYSESIRNTSDANRAENKPDSVITYEPTNQVGGIVAGKPEGRDPRTLAKIRQKNSLQPIIWGKSIGAIGLNMPEQMISNRLSAKLHSSASSDRYAEGIQVVWQSNTPRTPLLIAASKDYYGKLQLNDAIGDLYVDRDLSSVLTELNGTQNFMRALGRLLEKQSNAYDCRSELSCRISYFNNLIYLDFKLGGITIDQDNKIEQIYLKKNDGIFFPRLKDDIIFGESIAGISLSSNQDGIEKRIGPPQAVENFLINYYDDFNLSIIWKPDHTPFRIAATKGYLGKIVFNRDILPGRSTFNMGDSLADAIYTGQAAQPFDDFIRTSPLDNDLEMIAIYLGNKLESIEDENTNCLADGTCKITETRTSFLIDFSSGAIALTKDANRQITLVMIVERPNT